MSVLITEKIGIQNFEIIKNKLGVILLLEISNQIKLHCFDIDFGVFTDRQEPIDKSEDIVINVSLVSNNSESINQKGTNNLLTFNIDIYSYGYATLEQEGNDIAREKLDLILGWVRYILASTKYKTLGFPAGFIGGTYVNSIQYDTSYDANDANYTRMAQINFTVKSIDNQDMWNGIELLANDTITRLYDTNQGYKLTFNK